MTTTTRRVNKSELIKIKEIQNILNQKNIKLSQADISEMITDFALDNLEGFIDELNLKLERNSEDQELLDFLNNSYSGKDETDSVKEHDVII